MDNQTIPDIEVAPENSAKFTKAGIQAGVVGAATALSVGELAEGASETIPSLVVAVGELISDYTPGDFVAFSITNVGDNQKPVLLGGIVLVSLAVGGLLGRFAIYKQTRLTILGFVTFGLIGGWAAARNPFSPAFASWVIALAAAAAGLAATLALVHLATVLISRENNNQESHDLPSYDLESYDLPHYDPTRILPEDTEPDQNETGVRRLPAIVKKWANRRSFLFWATGAAGSAMTLVGIGRRLRGPSAAELARETITLPVSDKEDNSGTTPNDVDTGQNTNPDSNFPNATVSEQVKALDTFDEVEGIATYISPNNGFYRIDTALAVPQVDPASWSLRFTGMVDSPYELSFDEILDMDMSEYPITLSCVSNRIGGDLVGNAVWTGIPLADLLEKANVQPGANQVIGRSVDDWTAGFPIEVVHDGRNAILAVGMNGVPLPIRHGFPARLVVAGLYGYVSAVKWIEEIRLDTWEGFDGFWVPRGWSKEGPMKTQSRIDVPQNRQELKIDVPTPIAGVAWSPTRGISAVEVRINGGPWRRCELGEAYSGETWVQWRLFWTPTKMDTYDVQVRAIDSQGQMQSEGPKTPRPNGAEGWHNIQVNVV